MSHLQANYDREVYLHDLAFLCNDLQALLLAADTTADTSDMEEAVAKYLKTIAVLHTTIYDEYREVGQTSRRRAA